MFTFYLVLFHYMVTISGTNTGKKEKMDTITANYKDTEADLEQLFQELDGGFKIQVLRIEPEWCKGTLGTFDFMPGETVSTDWLVERFGGRKLQVKILHQDSSYNSARTVIFPEAPRKDGIQIVQGPEGSPITIHERDASKTPLTPPQQDNSMMNMMEKLLTITATNAQTNQKMMLDRIGSLETLLTTKITEPAPTVVTGIVPADPQSQLRQTLETVQAIEELKNVMGGGGEIPEPDGEPENPLYNTIIEKIVDKFSDKLTDTPNQTSDQDLRQLPPPTEQSNLQLAQLIKERLKTMPEQERDLLLSHVFEDEDEETPMDSGQDPSTDLKSLLTEEDLEALRSEDGDENNEGQTIPSCDVSPVS